MKHLLSSESLIQFLLVVLITFILVVPGTLGASRSINPASTTDPKIVSKVSREIEIPPDRPPKIQSLQISLFEESDALLRNALETLDLDRLTPIEALLELKKLQELARTGRNN